MSLDRDSIVDAALALLDEVGLDALSTRALAQRLGVKQPALYWHFKSRRALLDAMNDRMLGLAHEHRVPRANDTWNEFLWRVANGFRDALLSHRDGARIHAGTEATLDDLEPSEKQLRFLVAAGFSATQALDVLVAISRYTVGCVLEEQAESERTPDLGLDEGAAHYPLLSVALEHYRRQGHAAAFEHGLNMLIRGAALTGKP
jgi:TetR/AcrR family tetracycline transcriptional repressor